MAGYSARASVYTTGDTISAADTNDEFGDLLTAFGTSGHVHDGSAGNGGNVTALRGHALTFGLGTAGTDVVVTFDGETGDGVFSWMEDEDYFKFTDDVLMNSTEKLYFQDTGTYIYSNADGDLDIVSDGTAVDSINLESAGGITLDAGTAGSGIVYEDDGTEMLRVHNSSSDVVIESKVSDKDIIFKGNDGGSTVTAMTLDMSDAGRVIIAGDLTISGDDLTMGTNTSGYIMVADGANFNPVVVSGDVTMASNGAVTIASQAVENSMLADDAVGADELAANAVVNASVASGAAIAFSKMADLTASRALVSDGSGDVSVSSVTSTELGYLDISTLGTSEASKAVTVDSNGDLLVPDSDKYKFGTGSDMQIYHDGTNAYITNSEGALKIATESSGIAVTIGHSTSVVTVADNLTVTGDLTVNGDTTTVNTATLSVEDPLIIMASGNNSADSVDIGFYGLYDTSGSQDLYSGLFRDASDSGKWKLFKDNQAAPSTTVNTSGTGYAVGTLVADLEGNVTGNASGTALTVTQAAQSSITSLGTLTTLTVDSININGTTIGHTSATDAMTISSGGIVTFKDDIVLKDAATIGNASVADVMTLASTGIVTFKDDILLKDACTIGTATTAGAIAIAADGTVNLATAAATVNSAVIKTAGLETIWVPASSMTVSVNAPSADIASIDSGSVNTTVPVLDFDPGSSDEVATFNVAFPKAWNASTITARFFWTNSDANSGNVVWGLQGVCIADSGPLNTAMTDAGEVIQDANITTAGDLMVTSATPAITINGAADDGVCFFNVFRDASDTTNDTYATDARLVGVQIFYTTNAATDA